MNSHSLNPTTTKREENDSHGIKREIELYGLFQKLAKTGGIEPVRVWKVSCEKTNSREILRTHHGKLAGTGFEPI